VTLNHHDSVFFGRNGTKLLRQSRRYKHYVNTPWRHLIRTFLFTIVFIIQCFPQNFVTLVHIHCCVRRENVLTSVLYVTLIFNNVHTSALYRGADKSLARQGRKISYSDKRFWVSYILFIIIIGGILVLFIYITGLASNEIFSGVLISP